MIGDLLAEGRLFAFKKKAVIYSEGDKAPFIGFLLEGEIRVFKTGPRERVITLYEIFPGETCILNASCILAGRTHPASAEASTDGSILLVPDVHFRKLVSDHEDMRQFVFRLFSDRLASIVELVEEVVFARMDERLDNYLLEKSENEILLSTHQKIADDLGTSREVVSRLLKDLERKGKVRLGRNMIQLLSL